jgi:predicted Zn-dependent protease
MYFSNSILDTDSKECIYCGPCEWYLIGGSWAVVSFLLC